MFERIRPHNPHPGWRISPRQPPALVRSLPARFFGLKLLRGP
jgi:hypothetical protein